MAALFLDGFEGASGDGDSHDAEGVAFEFEFEPLRHGYGGGFAAFNYDVSGESVTEHDVEFVFEE